MSPSETAGQLPMQNPWLNKPLMKAPGASPWLRCVRWWSVGALPAPPVRVKGQGGSRSHGSMNQLKLDPAQEPECARVQPFQRKTYYKRHAKSSPLTIPLQAVDREAGVGAEREEWSAERQGWSAERKARSAEWGARGVRVEPKARSIKCGREAWRVECERGVQNVECEAGRVERRAWSEKCGMGRVECCAGSVASWAWIVERGGREQGR